MKNTSTLIKWPGGKTNEMKYIKPLIPSFERYVEPFFGGGALYFHLEPKRALINDVSKDLMGFYAMVKGQDGALRRYLLSFHGLWKALVNVSEARYDSLLPIYEGYKAGRLEGAGLTQALFRFVSDMRAELSEPIVGNRDCFEGQLVARAADKIRRTVKNERKGPFSPGDLKQNLITGFASGAYMYWRSVYNDILTGRERNPDPAYRAAVFYFIREYCYGSMFRYNGEGEFNIPYGGISYNRKDFKGKIDRIFSDETVRLMAGTQLYCMDFEDFLGEIRLTEEDFMFLDPPYDTDFSAYEGRAFGEDDQRRLARTLKKTRAKFILIIKNTDFIYSLYRKDFPILCFDKTYTYNVRSRNERNAEHLIVTNLEERPV